MVNGPPPASAGSSSSQASTERSNRQSYYSPTAWQSTQPSAGGSNTYETIYAPNVPYSGYQSTAFHQPPQPTASDDSTHNWDKIFRSFLAEVGLTQTLQGFESDMLVLNDKWERKKVPLALRTLVNELSALRDPEAKPSEMNELSTPLSQRKLDYVHLPNEMQPKSQTAINQSISSFLAQNRVRNDASNRAEFLFSLSEKRELLAREAGHVDLGNLASCARVDAKPIDRDVQMKYEIMKNEDGPLRRTMKHVDQTGAEQQIMKLDSHTNRGIGGDKEDSATAAQYPALDERLLNIETHLAMRYVPSVPRTLLARLKFIEDHLIELEKQYPPWAALHFNQPNRGWPPPPRSTPVIVPSHLRPTDKDLLQNRSTSTFTSQSNDPVGSGPATLRNTTSSLHRAVMERLEVQKAINDLSGTNQTYRS